jgi:hypothetical protein
MNFQSFGLSVTKGKETKDGYVVMSHGQQYEVVLSNETSRRCNCLLSIDGKQAGLFRLEAQSSMTLERPLHDTGRFTFYKLESKEGHLAALQPGGELGLVQAVFTPEAGPAIQRHNLRRKAEPAFPDDDFDDSDPYSDDENSTSNIVHKWVDRVPESAFSEDDFCDADCFSAEEGMSPSSLTHEAGGTGLTGASGQKFYDAENIELDIDAQVTLTLRLIAHSLEVPRPLTAVRATPIPPPIHKAQ